MLLFVYSLLMIVFQKSKSMPTHISEMNIHVGKPISIKCDLDNPEGNVIIWKHKKRVLFAGDIRVRHDDRIKVVEDNLVIENVKVSDNGIYACETEYNDGEFRTLSVLLNVLEPPVAKITQGSHLTVKAGTSLALTCSGYGTPLPEVRWIKNGKVLARGVGEASVLLEYLTRQDQGDIVCEAINEIGETHLDTLTLDVLYAPEVVMSDPQISFQPKCGMEFQCLVHSSSSPTVQWYNNDLLLQPTAGVTMWSLDNLHVLQIHSCDQKILGQFNCIAENRMGKGQKSATVHKDFIERKMEEYLEKKQFSNNVRRNVNHKEAQPLVHSDSGCLFSSSLLVLVAFLFL